MGTTGTLDRNIGWSAVGVPATTTVPVAVAAMSLLSLVRLADAPAPHSDQWALLQASWSGPRWPAPMHGPLSESAAATVGLVVPPGGQAHDLVFRLLAAVVLLIVVAVAARQVLRSTWGPTVAVVVVGLSPVPVMWPTSETIAATALLAVAVAASRRSGWGVGVACFALAASKPDTVASALLLVGWFAWQWRDWRPAAGMAAAVAVTMAPGTLLLDGYWSYLDGESRTWVAFGQHFANTVGVATLPGGPSPWAGWEFYTARLLPGAHGIVDVIARFPGRYLEFLQLGALRGLAAVAMLFGPLVAGAGWAAGRWRSWSVTGRGLILAALGMAPNWLLAFPGERHLTRWVPLAVLAAVVAAESDGRRTRTFGVAVLVGAAVWYAGRIVL